jgi:hypothetical protein
MRDIQKIHIKPPRKHLEAEGGRQFMKEKRGKVVRDKDKGNKGSKFIASRGFLNKKTWKIIAKLTLIIT